MAHKIAAGAKEAITVDVLRAELDRFAKDALQRELAAMKSSIIRELRSEGTSDAGTNTKAANKIAPGGDAASASAMPTPEREDTSEKTRLLTSIDRELEAPSASERRGLCGGIQALVAHPLFANVFSGLIVLNAIVIGVETDYMARNWTLDGPFVFSVLDRFFCLLFLVEIALRLVAYGCGGFFCGKAWKWNWFDFLVVGLQVVEIGFELAMSLGLHSSLSPPGRAFTHLRLLRVIRIVRVGRVMHLVPELRVLIESIFESFWALFWTVVMLLLVTFGFAVSLTQIVTEHKVAVGREEMETPGAGAEEKLEKFYGNLGTSTLFLYEAIADGIHWNELLEPLYEHVSPWMSVAFIIYMSFVLFSLLNIVTSFFVESAMEAARERSSEDILRELQALLNFSGEGGNKKVSREDIDRHLKDADVRRRLKKLGLDLSAARGVSLFDLLDEDKSNDVTAKEFVQGCLNLAGPARSLDLAMLMHEFRAK